MNVDEGAMEKRRKYCQIENEDLSIPELQDRHTGAIIEWDNFKQKTKESKEKKLLELYPTEIAGDSDEAKKKWKKAIKSVKFVQYRQYTFDRLSKGVGKGEKNSLKQVRKVKEDGEVLEIFQDRKSIEQAIAQHNIGHFRQAFTSKAYKDKIYNKLQQNNIRDKILSRELDILECDDNDMYEFLVLLKKRESNSQSNELIDISELE